MKKFLVFFVVLTLTVGFAFAQVGLSADLEFGIFDVNNANDVEEYPYIYAGIGYGNTFVDTLDFSVGVGVEFGLNQEDVEDTKKNPLFLYADVGLGYGISLNDAASLSINVDSENCIDLYSGADDNFDGILWPGLTFNLGTDAGGIYLTAQVPFGYVGYLKNSLGLNLKLGWDSAFGLGFEAAGHFLLKTDKGLDDYTGFTGLSFSVSYGLEALYFGVDVTVPLKTVDLGIGEYTLPYSYFDMYAHDGIAISPSIRYNIFEGFDAHAGCTFKYIGLENQDVGINFTIGLSCSF